MSEVINVSVIIFNRKDSRLNFDLDTLNLLGKTSLEWVKRAVIGTGEIRVIELDNEKNSLTLLKQNVPNSYYTIVLYSDTPLLTFNTVKTACNYLNRKGMRSLRLTRGYIFRTDEIRRIVDLDKLDHAYFDEEDFITISTPSQIPLIIDILRQRINSYYLNNGVLIYDTNTTYIDSNSVIEKGVVLYPNVHIKGRSLIKTGAVIKENSTIENSTIEEGVIITKSDIINSKITKNQKIGPFVYIKDQL